MGCYSWLDCKSGEQIKIGDSKEHYLLVPKKYAKTYGEKIPGAFYQGYGVIGGYDVFELIAIWNGYKPDGDEDGARNYGIDLLGDESKPPKYTIKITHDASATYEECNASLIDEAQGL